MNNLATFTDILDDEIENSQPISLPSSISSVETPVDTVALADNKSSLNRPVKGTGQYGQFRSVEEIDAKYRDVFSHSFFNVVQSRVIDDALYSDKSLVICAPTGSGKTVIFEMAIVQLLMSLDDKNYSGDFKIIYMAPVKALCNERLSEWYSKFTKLGLLCIEVTGDTDVDFSQLKPYRIIITTPEKWDMLTRRWRDHKALVEVIKLFLIDEVHILNDQTRGPVLEAVVSRMKTIESSVQSNHRIEQIQKQCQGTIEVIDPPRIRFVAVSATVSNPEDVASWLGTAGKPAVFYKFGDECRPVKLKRVVEGYPCSEGTSIFKFDIILNYKLWPIIQKYHDGKPTLIFCNTRKGVVLTAETLSKELTINFNPEQKARLVMLASKTKNKKLQALILSGVGCHHAGMLLEERMNIEQAFRNRDLPILITTTTLAMGVNLPAHLVIIKNTQQYVNGAYQEYSISTVLQMVGRAGRPQFDTEATAVIMTRLADKHRYEALVGGNEPLQSFLHKRLAENLNSEAALGTVSDVAECVQWLRSTFLFVRSIRDPRRYLGLPPSASQSLISKKIEELCVKAMNSLATAGLITMDEASCIESTDAGRLMSIYYLDVETMKNIMKIEGSETIERLLALICESHEMSDMHLRVDERRCLNALNRNNTAATIRFPMKGKITTRQMKLNCIIQAVLGCLPITDPSLNQEAMKVMRVADRICKCLVAYVTRPDIVAQLSQFFSAVMNSIILAKCVAAHLWENSPFVSKQLKGIGPTFSALLATSGKVNFMLLEESHPRDLERIMNKGPPAGNTLRKQISLLPKYQLVFTPINERTITLQLMLQNVSYLSENMEHLTAGETHKSYIIVGDSDNHLLLLTTIRDKDLISFYDGSITYEITRKRNCEHKIFAHCISSNFVGIDAQCEFLFKDLEIPPCISNVIIPAKKVHQKQSCITDVFKQRKRKHESNLIPPSKRKLEYAVFQKFNELKEPFNEKFDTLSKNITSLKVSPKECFKNDIPTHESFSRMNRNELNNDTQNIFVNKGNVHDVIDLSTKDALIENDEDIDDEQINSLLNKIENEISLGQKEQRSQGLNAENISCAVNLVNNGRIKGVPIYSAIHTNSEKTVEDKYVIHKILSDLELHRDMRTKPRKMKNTKSNYNFMELLENNNKFSDGEEDSLTINRHTGFSSAIKTNIDKYIKAIKDGSVKSNDINQLVSNTEIRELTNVDLEPDCIISAPLATNNSDINCDNCCKNYEVKSLHKNDTQISKGDNLIRLEINKTIESPNLKNSESDTVLKLIEPTSVKTFPQTKQNTTISLFLNSDCKKDREQLRWITKSYSNILNAHGSYHNITNSELDESLATDRSVINNVKNDNDSENSNAYKPVVLDEKRIVTNSYLEKELPKELVKFERDFVENSAFVQSIINTYSIITNSYRTVSVKSEFARSVQVISKWNVNVDITKSITTKKVVGKLNAVRKVTCDNSSVNTESMKETTLNQHNILCNTMSAATNYIIPVNNEDEYRGITKNARNEDRHLMTTTEDELTKNSQNQKCIHFQHVTNEEQNNRDNNVNSDPASLSEEIFNEKCYTNSNTIQANSKCINEFESSQISRILQKYSTLLREKSTNPGLSQSVNTFQNETTRQSFKPSKKPFKIRDIQNGEIVLPDTLTYKSSSNINSILDPSLPMIDSLYDQYESIPADLLYTKQSAVDEELHEVKDADFQENDPLQWLSTADNPQESNFKIHESLFDPKALLQCLKKDNVDDIIPPPPQFRDNFSVESISPEKSTVSEIEKNKRSDGNFKYTNFSESKLICRDIESQYSQLSFDDYCHSDWPSQTCTPEEQHLPTRTIPLHNTVLSRRNILKKFKFPQKKKMKV